MTKWEKVFEVHFSNTEFMLRLPNSYKNQRNVSRVVERDQ